MGYKTPTYLEFGWASARFDDLVNWIPARLAGVFLCLAAALGGHGAGRNAWRVMRRDARHHHSPNAGWPESAMAGALQVKLQGTRVYPGGEVLDDPWIGEGTPDATPAHIRRSLHLFVLGCVICAVVALAPLSVPAAIAFL